MKLILCFITMIKIVETKHKRVNLKLNKKIVKSILYISIYLYSKVLFHVVLCHKSYF